MKYGFSEDLMPIEMEFMRIAMDLVWISARLVRI